VAQGCNLWPLRLRILFGCKLSALSFQLSAFWERLLLPYRYLKPIDGSFAKLFFKKSFALGFLTVSW
jgi:hypothetical protein